MSRANIYSATIYYKNGFCGEYYCRNTMAEVFKAVRKAWLSNTISSRIINKIQVFEVNECSCVVREWVFRSVGEFQLALKGGAL